MGYAYRFIPTCVGKLRGQKNPLSDSIGSSPRVWGNYKRLSTSLGLMTVHPHVCGETGISDRMAAKLGGSSPRVWGNSLRSGFNDALRRFIPTCVGKLQ